MSVTLTHTWSDELLARLRERAPIYDQANRFFDEDFAELQDADYLRIAVPEEFGGLGLTLPQVIQEQRRLAYHAHATALAVNMHLYWTGVAADLWRAGDTSLAWLLREAAHGEVFAAGHAESGNDLPVLLSATQAERVDGGYRFTGRKSFSSLTPVWTYMGLHGMDSSDPAAPKYAWAMLGFANVYYGLAQHAFDWTVVHITQKTSLALSRSLAYHPEVQHAMAEMAPELEAIGPHLDRVAQDWANGVEHGAA